MDECVKDITVMACGAVEWSTNTLSRFYASYDRSGDGNRKVCVIKLSSSSYCGLCVGH